MINNKQKINIILCSIVLILSYVFMITKFFCHNDFLNVFLKGSASIFFVLCCIFNIIFSNQQDKKISINKWFLLAGQIFACAGDITLNFNFKTGTALFAIGHIMFFISFFLIKKFRYTDIFIIILICTISILTISFIPNIHLGNFASIVYGYSIFISIMLASAILIFNDKKILKQHRTLIFTGAFLFYLSDFMLLLFMFSGHNIFFDMLCLILYYPAECLLALSAKY